MSRLKKGKKIKDEQLEEIAGGIDRGQITKQQTVTKNRTTAQQPARGVGVPR